MEPFFVPLSNLPFIYSGTQSSYIKGLSSFAYLILDKQKDYSSFKPITYLFANEDCHNEKRTSGRITATERFEKTKTFFEKHFQFIKNIEFTEPSHLYIYTCFLDQIATDSFQYIDFGSPRTSDIYTAYKSIGLSTADKNIPEEKYTAYKEELLQLLFHYYPEAYFAIVF